MPLPNVVAKKRKRAKKSTKQITEAARSDGAGTCKVGDFVLLSPDQESRETDVKMGYFLGINLAQITNVSFKKDTNSFTVDMEYWSAQGWDKMWKPMIGRHNDSVLLEEGFDVDNLLQDSHGCIAAFAGKQHKKGMKLTKEEVEIALEIIRLDDATNSSEFANQ